MFALQLLLLTFEVLFFFLLFHILAHQGLDSRLLLTLALARTVASYSCLRFAINPFSSSTEIAKPIPRHFSIVSNNRCLQLVKLFAFNDVPST